MKNENQAPTSTYSQYLAMIGYSWEFPSYWSKTLPNGFEIRVTGEGGDGEPLIEDWMIGAYNSDGLDRFTTDTRHDTKRDFVTTVLEAMLAWGGPLVLNSCGMAADRDDENIPQFFYAEACRDGTIASVEPFRCTDGQAQAMALQKFSELWDDVDFSDFEDWEDFMADCDGGGIFPVTDVQALHQLGLLNMTIPAERVESALETGNAVQLAVVETGRGRLYYFDDSQHATVLAALRYWQSGGFETIHDFPQPMFDIATLGGTIKPLDMDDIDSLCEEFNCDGHVDIPHPSEAKPAEEKLEEFKVSWELDVTAANPREAAKKALAIQRCKGSGAVTFNVSLEDGSVQDINLDDETD